LRLTSDGVFEQAGDWADRPGVAEIGQRLDRRRADFAVRIREHCDQGRHGARIAQASERVGGGAADARVLVLEARDEGVDDRGVLTP